MNLINKFFIYSILGHLLENIAMPNYTSGILYGYWTPVYGIGAIIIILINIDINRRIKTNKILKTIILFISCSIILSSIEYFGGKIIEIIFNKTFWDYSNHKYNFGKYASLEMSLTWGILSVVLIYLIEPIIKKIEKKIPKVITYILILLFITDIIFTLIFKTK